MILDGKPVGLILHPCYQLESLRTGIDGNLNIIIIQPSRPVMVILDHAADGNGKLKLRKHFQGDIHLSSSAVHHQKIRESGKTAGGHILSRRPEPLCLVNAVGEPPCQHLLHGSVVIRPLHCADPELPVIIPLRLSVLKHHHGAHRLKSADIGDIVGLHPVNIRKADPGRHLVHGPDGPKLFPLDLVPVLRQHHIRVLLRQLHQLFLLALLRHDDAHLLAAALGKVPSDHLRILDLLLKPDLMGHKGGAGIILAHKHTQNLGAFLVPGHAHMEMLPSDHLAVPDKEHLHHRVPLLAGNGDDVPVIHALAGDLLALLHLLHAFQKLPVLDGLLKLQRIAGRLHPALQLLRHLPVIAVQKGQHLTHLLPVILLRDIPHAGRIALVDVVIEAGPFLADILRQLPAAVPDMVEAVHQVDGILHRR